MTRHYEFFSPLNGSFELRVKLRALGRKQQKGVQSKTIFSITERNTSIHILLYYTMSDEESHSARKRMWKTTSGVFILFFLRIALNGPYNIIYNLCDVATSESGQFVIVKNKWMSVFHESVLL